MLCKDVLVERLKSKDIRITKEEEEKFQHAGLKRAAVLVPLFIKNDVVNVLLTVRSKTMRSYSGDVAFPGGNRDKSDCNDDRTALREAHEEIGLQKNDVQIISHGPHFTTKTNHIVIPVIGFIPNNFSPCLNLDEVEDCFSVPLMEFLKPDKHNHRIIGSYLLHEFYHTIEDKTYVTWGLTAAICIEIASIVFDRKPDFHFISKL